jgi:hypothetical protein
LNYIYLLDKIFWTGFAVKKGYRKTLAMNASKAPTVTTRSIVFNAGDQLQMPKNSDINSWREYVEEGNRKLCKHEITILKRFIRRMTGVHKRLVFPARFARDRPTAIYLWTHYLVARQTRAEAAMRGRSFQAYKVDQARASLDAAREQLNERLETDPKMIAHILKGKKSSEAMKNCDWTKPPPRRTRKTVELRPKPKGMPPQLPKGKPEPMAPLEGPPVVDLMVIDEVPVSPLFNVNIAAPKPTANLLRMDQTLGKYMVKRGKESPLRQSITVRELTAFEQEMKVSNERLERDIEGLKKQIAAYERKNFGSRPKFSNLSSGRGQSQSPRTQLDGR